MDQPWREGGTRQNSLQGMPSWKKNMNKLNGITVKHSDMQYGLKDQITLRLSEIFKDDPNVTFIKVSKLMTEFLNLMDPSGWICLIGKEFIANISHQPRKFIIMVYRNCSFLVYKAINEP